MPDTRALAERIVDALLTDDDGDRGEIYTALMQIDGCYVEIVEGTRDEAINCVQAELDREAQDGN